MTTSDKGSKNTTTFTFKNVVLQICIFSYNLLCYLLSYWTWSSWNTNPSTRHSRTCYLANSWRGKPYKRQFQQSWPNKNTKPSRWSTHLSQQRKELRFWSRMTWVKHEEMLWTCLQFKHLPWYSNRFFMMFEQSTTRVASGRRISWETRPKSEKWNGSDPELERWLSS